MPKLSANMLTGFGIIHVGRGAWQSGQTGDPLHMTRIGVRQVLTLWPAALEEPADAQADWRWSVPYSTN